MGSEGRKDRLIIVTDAATATRETRNAITHYLQSKGWETWHWFEDLWLVVGVPETVQTQQLRDELMEAVGRRSRFFIFKLEGRTPHSGLVQPKSMPWLEKFWSPNADPAIPPTESEAP